MQYIQINIGRNHDDEPIDDDLWAEFQNHMERIIQYNEIDPDGGRTIDRLGVPIAVERHYGIGDWNGAEESCHLSAVSPRGFNVENIRVALASAKEVWGQDAIALIVGSELI